MISGQRCLVLGRVTEPGEFLELSGDALRTLVARDAELSEILMRAFILRRLALVTPASGTCPAGLAPLRPDPESARISQPQRTPVHLCRSRHRPDLAGPARSLPGADLGSAGGDLQCPRRAAQPVDPGTGRLPGLQRQRRRHARARPDHRRRRAGRSGGGGLCGVGRAQRAGDRDHRPRRAGGIELQDRKLPGLPDRRLRAWNWRRAPPRRRRSSAPI